MYKSILLDLISNRANFAVCGPTSLCTMFNVTSILFRSGHVYSRALHVSLLLIRGKFYVFDPNDF